LAVLVLNQEEVERLLDMEGCIDAMADALYVIDIRNGLYVLRYTGPHADEVAGISFLGGNSKLGDAERIAKSAGP
jgi:hypothetical protein